MSSTEALKASCSEVDGSRAPGAELGTSLGAVCSMGPCSYVYGICLGFKLVPLPLFFRPMYVLYRCLAPLGLSTRLWSQTLGLQVYK